MRHWRLLPIITVCITTTKNLFLYGLFNSVSDFPFFLLQIQVNYFYVLSFIKCYNRMGKSIVQNLLSLRNSIVLQLIIFRNPLTKLLIYY